MCGRFALFTLYEKLAEQFPEVEIVPQDVLYLQPNYNIAPTQSIVALPNDGSKALGQFHWGLLTYMPKDGKRPFMPFNARAESLAEKPMFKNSYKSQRCLIFADGFFEWSGPKGNRQPYYIRMKSKEPFAFAGLWAKRDFGDGPIQSATIITREPNELVAQLHDRMPVILPEETHELWLNPEEMLPEQLDPLLTAYPAEEMEFFPVNKLTGNDPGNVNPLASQGSLGI